MTSALDWLLTLARGLGALAAAFLPRRHWQKLPALPIERVAVLSGVTTAMTALALGGFGFIRYARAVADGAATVTLQIAERQARNEVPGDITTLSTQGISALAIFGFVLFTPLGLFASYLCLSGIVRAAAAAVEDPWGDPILTAIDAIAARSGQRTRQASTRQAREKQEGPERPDRLLPAACAGLATFDYVVVSSRVKPGWTAGTAVITEDKWYTLGEPFEMRLREGLRTVYPLREQRAAEVLRRAVQYQLPPLEEDGSLRVVSRPRP